MSNQVDRIEAGGRVNVQVGDTHNHYGHGYDVGDEQLARLRSTDPRHDKTRIEKLQGGLLVESYRWVLGTPEFSQWENNDDCELLLIKGNPGKGKTMLICDIIEYLTPLTKLKNPDSDVLFAFFFCQATNSGLNNATAVLKGLIYLLLVQQPSLDKYLPKNTGFMDPDHWNSRVAAEEIFQNIIKDRAHKYMVLIIDALDECEVDQTALLDFIHATQSSRIRWIVSSRNRPIIEERILTNKLDVPLCLELNETSVSEAIAFYIEHKVGILADRKRCTHDDSIYIKNFLTDHAHGTFLWVALVCQELEYCLRSDLKERIAEFPQGLYSLYRKMMHQIKGHRNPMRYAKILAIATLVHRPLSVQEFGYFVPLPSHDKDINDLVQECRSFLTIQNGSIYFVHQSGKDFLLETSEADLFPTGMQSLHYEIFEKSLTTMGQLPKDIYRLGDLGTHVDFVDSMTLSMTHLGGLQYSCLFWAEHLHQASMLTTEHGVLQQNMSGLNHDGLYHFLSSKSLFWIEILCLLRSLSIGVSTLAKLQKFFKSHPRIGFASKNFEFISDALHFILYFRQAIEEYPLQIYASGLAFSPKKSLLRQHFHEHASNWPEVILKRKMDWDKHVQVLQPGSAVQFLAFSPESDRLVASAQDESFGQRLVCWDVNDGARQNFKPPENPIRWQTLSPNWRWWACITFENQLEVWQFNAYDLEVKALHWAEPNIDFVAESYLAFSPDGQWLAVLSNIKIQLWNVQTHSVKTYYQSNYSRSFPECHFSSDSQRVVCYCRDNVQIVDLHTGQSEILHNRRIVKSVKFLPGSHHLVLIFNYRNCRPLFLDEYLHPINDLNTFLGGNIEQIEFSPDGRWVAVALSTEPILRLYNAKTSTILREAQLGSLDIETLIFSHDSQRLVASSVAGDTFWLWDINNVSIEHNGDVPMSAIDKICYSNDWSLIATKSCDQTLKLWDAHTLDCLFTYEVMDKDFNVGEILFSQCGRFLVSNQVTSVAIFDVNNRELKSEIKIPNCALWISMSNDAQLLATSSADWEDISVWDTNTGELRNRLRLLDFLDEPCDTELAFNAENNALGIGIKGYGHDLVLLWDFVANLLTRIPHIPPARRLCRDLSFSANGRFLSILTSENMVLWDLVTGNVHSAYAATGGRIQFVDNSTIQTDRGIADVGIDDRSIISFQGTEALECDGDSSCEKESEYGQGNSYRLETQIVSFNGVGLSETHCWVMWNGNKVLWLPAEYRPMDYISKAIARNTIVVGCPCGRVLKIDFSSNDGDE